MAREALETCLREECDLAPDCPMACAIGAARTYHDCIEDDGTSIECAMEAAEFLNDCLIGCAP